MNSVQVRFNDPKYNYITSVSAQSSKQSCTDYFVGEAFNVGQYPKDDYQRCVDIKFINNNEVTA